ncbi:glycoside hydrolase [Spirochaetia bacterium]|nr:glycoside hydrolase [Spirochaetia bacterium]
MQKKNAVAIILNAHLPFIRHPELVYSYEELPFFTTISETLLPLLEMLERLEAGNIKCKFSISISPTLCHLLKDEFLLKRYTEYVERQISFGKSEMKRTRENRYLYKLAKYYYIKAVYNKELFLERYDKNIIKVFASFQKKDFIEILAATATNCFLPFYKDRPFAVKSQIETGIKSYIKNFGTPPKGFLLCEDGWFEGLDEYLDRANINWTIVDTHAVLLSKPPAKFGCFFPVRAKSDAALFVNDYYANRDITDRTAGLTVCPEFRDYFDDVVDELPANDVKLFLSPHGLRTPSGYKYHALGESGKEKKLYRIEEAREKAKFQARVFFERRVLTLNEASANALKNDRHPFISVCSWKADLFGRFWHEGTHFLENLFKLAGENPEIELTTPSQYLKTINHDSIQKVQTEFSSSSSNGYAEILLDASNDWTARHINHALERMCELSNRFSNETGLRERALNQALREVLLAMSSDWLLLMNNNNEHSAADLWRNYAKQTTVNILRNFTTIYESLGSSYLSTRFLTELESRHNIFPLIDYRLFKRTS